MNINRHGEAAPGPKGTVMSVVFQLNGQEFIALNGGPLFKFTEALSLFVSCKMHEEVDIYSAKLLEGGEESQRDWLKEEYGLSWQIIPTLLGEMLSDPDRQKANRVMEAMLKMRKLTSPN